MYPCSFRPQPIPIACHCPFFCSSQCQRMSGKSNAIRHASSTHSGLKTSCLISESLVSFPSFCGFLPPVPRHSYDSSSEGIRCDPTFSGWATMRGSNACHEWANYPENWGGPTVMKTMELTAPGTTPKLGQNSGLGAALSLTSSAYDKSYDILSHPVL